MLSATSEMIAKKIKSKKHNKSPRAGGILATALILSLKGGVVPFEWKETNITPLFKRISINKSENYRPVSLTHQ